MGRQNHAASFISSFSSRSNSQSWKILTGRRFKAERRQANQ
jgi:hypothetical protein